MKNVKIAAAAALVFGSMNAFADTNELAMSGSVAPHCNVSGLTTFTFPALTAGASTTISGVSLRCNDGDGAELSMTSSEGGLESDDVEDFGLL